MGLEWRGCFPGGGDLRAWREGRGGSCRVGRAGSLLSGVGSMVVVTLF